MRDNSRLHIEPSNISLDQALRVGKTGLKSSRQVNNRAAHNLSSLNENNLGPTLQEPSSLKYEGLHQKLTAKYN